MSSSNRGSLTSNSMSVFPTHRAVNKSDTDSGSETPLSSGAVDVWKSLGDDSWKLIIEGYYHEYGKMVFDNGLHPLGIEEPGYYEGVQNGLAFGATLIQNNTKFDRKIYLELHRIICLSLSNEVAERFRGSWDSIGWASKVSLKKPIHLLASALEGISEQGKELYLLMRQALESKLFDNAGFCFELDEYGITYDSLTQSEIEDKLDSYFSDFYAEIKNAEAKSDLVLGAIWKLFNQLEHLHGFADGNGRTDIAVLQILLTQHHSHPALLKSPYSLLLVDKNRGLEILREGLHLWEKTQMQSLHLAVPEAISSELQTQARPQMQSDVTASAAELSNATAVAAAALVTATAAQAIEVRRPSSSPTRALGLDIYKSAVKKIDDQAHIIEKAMSDAPNRVFGSKSGK